MKNNIHSNGAGPVFIVASERSGTNLLRRRLTEAQSVLYGPSPLHILKHLYYAEPYYGDLSNNKNFISLIEDALNLAYKHFSPWDISFSAQDVLEKYPILFPIDRSVVGVMHVMYTMYAQAKGYKSYVCKDNDLFDFTCQIQKAIPEARFVYLYRDPRDVVLSQLKRPSQVKSVHYLARLWKEEQIKSIRSHTDLVRFGVSYSVSYEDLISNEESIIENICHWLGVKKSEGRQSTIGELTDIHEWKNLDKPTMINNKGKFMRELSESAIAKIESHVFHQMKWLGYEPMNVKRNNYREIYVEGEILISKIVRRICCPFNRKKLSRGQVERIKAAHEISKKWN